MKNRFGRAYKLYIQVGGKQYSFTELRIDFKAVKSIDGKFSNELDLSLYNITKEKQTAIQRTPAQDYKIMPIELHLGYKDNIALAFKGGISEAYTEKVGANFITKIKAFESENVNTEWQFISESTSDSKSAIDVLISKGLGVGSDTVTDKIPKTIRPIVAIGSVSDLINIYKGIDNDYFIDNGKVNIIPKNEAKTEYVVEVSNDTGLMSTPKNSDDLILVNTAINPSIRIAGKINLKSIYNKSINGVYKVQTIIYVGSNWTNDWYQELYIRKF